MAAKNQPAATGGSKGKKRKYLPHGKPVRKGSYPLHPGVQGFFLTCDGGRERQATNEALNLLDTYYEELVHGKDSGAMCKTVPSKPLNKIIKFKDSDSSGDEDECEESDAEKHAEESEDSLAKKQRLEPDASKCETTESDPHREESDAEKHAQESEDSPAKKQHLEPDALKCETKDSDPHREESDAEKHAQVSEDSPAKKQHLEPDALKCETKDSDKIDQTKDKCIDDLIEDELKELGDRNKRRFASLDSGCNGCVFIQMHKRAGDPGPAAIVQHMMTSASSTRKHMSRFILRVLPAEVTCYASEEEISNAIKPLIAQYFPNEAPTPQKFAVLYEARANTGVERMTIINAVAKSVPQPHKVDLKNPDKTIIVQIVKTICLVGVVERYKELSKYNLRQLTSPQEARN